MFSKVRNIFISHFIHSVLLFLPLIPLFSQNYTVKTFTTEDGLPNNNIRAIAEDSTGFLWFGTWDGLSRYDGYEFKNYFHVPGDTNSIPYFSIQMLLVDGANNLWVLTDVKQVVRYNQKTDNYKKYIFTDIYGSQLQISDGLEE
jgi:ligand-binding sensor domain-containing protein